MKRRMIGVLLAIMMVLALLPTTALAAQAGQDVTSFTIYATNDIHGVVDEGDKNIGLAQVAAIVYSQQNAILVDAGDATQGASFATVNEGGDMIEAMNAAAYNLMVAGNHEFDYGMDQLLDNAGAANFPILSANMTYNGEHVLKCHEIINREDKSVGFIGLTTTATKSNANPAGLAGVEFEDEIAAAKREIAEIGGETDAIVLVCHMGNNEAAVETTSKDLLDGLTDDELAKVTAVIDGHSHTVEDGTPYVRGDVSIPVIQTGTQLTALGYVTLTFSGDAVSAQGGVMDYEEAMSYTPADDYASTFPYVKETVAANIAAIKARQETVLGEKLIENLVPVWGGNVYWDYSENRIVETAYGDLVTDAFAALGKEFAEAQGLDLPVIALENGGGIAQPMNQGTVTYGDILGAFNHGNTVEAWKVTPAQLYAALEVGLTMTGQDDTGLILRERVSGSFLQVSGFTYTYDPAGETDAKVVDVTLDDGTALKRDDDTTQLLLATTNYVASFAGISRGEKLGELAGEDMAVRDWLMALTENGTVPLNYPVSDNRILYANDKSPETYTVSIPVLNKHDQPAAGLPVHVNVDGGAYEETVTDENGLVTVTVSKGPHAVGLQESGDYVYVNNYSGSGTVTTKTGYCEFAFHMSACDLPFTDVPEDAWYHDDVEYAFENGLVDGVSDTAFDPSSMTDRAMAAQVLWNLAGQPQVDYLMTYPDVADEQWYTEAVRWASSENVVNGCDDGSFHPDDPITREQLAVMIYRYEQSKGGGFTGAWMFLLDYPDAAQVSSWAYEAMCWCTMNGVITGKGDGSLDPQGQATRAELAAVLVRYAQLS